MEREIVLSSFSVKNKHALTKAKVWKWYGTVWAISDP